jgi:hypothetical protein
MLSAGLAWSRPKFLREMTIRFGSADETRRVAVLSCAPSSHEPENVGRTQICLVQSDLEEQCPLDPARYLLDLAIRRGEEDRRSRDMPAAEPGADC